MSTAALEHPFWWRVFERPDARFTAVEVAVVQCVTVKETSNGTVTPDLDVTALLVLRNGLRASIRARYDHTPQRITDVRWYVERPELKASAA